MSNVCFNQLKHWKKICSILFFWFTGRNLTFCELQRAINSARSEEFIPDCKANGEFEEVQCNQITGECWCVDTGGTEILDSRTIGLPYCHELGNVFILLDIGTYQSWKNQHQAYKRIREQFVEELYYVVHLPKFWTENLDKKKKNWLGFGIKA